MPPKGGGAERGGYPCNCALCCTVLFYNFRHEFVMPQIPSSGCQNCCCCRCCCSRCCCCCQGARQRERIGQHPLQPANQAIINTSLRLHWQKGQQCTVEAKQRKLHENTNKRENKQNKLNKVVITYKLLALLVLFCVNCICLIHFFHWTLNYLSI